MEINLSDIIKNDGSEKRFSATVNIEPVRYMGFVVSFDGGVQVDGSVHNVGGVLKLRAKAAGTLCTNCARCMKPLKEPFAVTVAETLIQEDAPHDEDGDIIVFSGYSLSLDGIVLDNVLVSMPIRYLCAQDCKGLCVKCGKDLNEGECGCTDKTVDPRLEVLSKLCDK